MLNTLKVKAVEWIVVTILLGGVFYAATTAWKNEEKLITVGEDVKSIKRSMISLLLDQEPDKSAIAKSLVSNITFLKGVERFKEGNFTEAYQDWEIAAKKGNRDSIYAIAIANDTLKVKLQQPDISESQRAEIHQVLQAAPKVKEKDGIYISIEPTHEQ